MIRPGQTYESCSGDSRSIRIIGDPRGGRVDAATVAADGRLLRRRSILTAQLHAGGTTQDGTPRRTGYRLLPDDEAPPAEQTSVRVGQVWADNDRRSTGRKVRVEEIDGTHAVVVQVNSRAVNSRMPVRRTRIRLDRFRPTSTGYRLITDAPEATP